MGLATMAQHRQQAAGFKAEEASPDSVSFYFAFLSEHKFGIPNQAHEFAHT